MWGGDFNQVSTSRATCAATKQHGLAVTSGLPLRPTCYMSVIFARIDHLLAKGCSANSTKIPTCLVTHRISRIPCYHVLVVALDYLGITKPTVSYLMGVWSLSWLIAIALSWAWLPVVFVFLILSVFLLASKSVQVGAEGVGLGPLARGVLAYRRPWRWQHRNWACERGVGSSLVP